MRILISFLVLLSSFSLTEGQFVTGGPDPVEEDPVGGLITTVPDCSYCNAPGARGTPVTDANFHNAVQDYLKNLGSGPSLSPYGSIINCWDVSQVTDMSYLFNTNPCKTLFNERLDCWDVSNVKYMEYMFEWAIRFNQPLNAWNVSNVQTMAGMFARAFEFNQPLDLWDVSNVRNMSYMFEGALVFNQPLNAWDVSNVVDMSGTFSNAHAFNHPLNLWDVSNVKSMYYMFNTAFVFNQPLNAWDVSNVENMALMFAAAKAFNQPLNLWDISNVKTMYYMFFIASSFNQDLCAWASKAILLNSVVAMFYGSGCDNKNDPVRRTLPYQNIYPGPFCHECINKLTGTRSPGSRSTQCTASNQCNAGDCNNSRASSGSGHICECTKKGTCELKYGKCLIDEDCKGRTVCSKGKCKEPKPGSRGSPCTASNQCNVGNCNYSWARKGDGRICKCSKKGICVLKSGKCDEKLRSADCKDGTICEKGKCKAPKPPKVLLISPTDDCIE